MMSNERTKKLARCTLAGAALALLGCADHADPAPSPEALASEQAATKPGGLDDFGLLATIQIPSDPQQNPKGTLSAIDVGWWDATARRFYLSDRSNAAVDVIDTRSGQFLYRVG